MACNPLTSGSCIVHDLTNVATLPGNLLGSAASTAANGAVGDLARTIQGAVETVAKDTVAWWVNLPSPDLTADPVPALIQQWLLPFTVAVALIGFITAGARMMLTRKAAPLADVGAGILTMAATTAVGTLLPTLLLKAGDAFSTYVLTAATGGKFAARFVDLVALESVTGGPAAAAGLVIVLGIFAVILATVQAILLLFRMGSVIILAGTLPLAAAGQMAPLTKPWFKRQVGWMLALIFYKPTAALVYATGFVLFGSGNSPQDLFMGFAVLALSLIALPALLKFFNWTTGQVETTSGGGLLSAVIGGAAAVGAMRGYGGMSAAGQASTVSGALGTAGGAASGGSASGGPRPGGQPPTGGGQGGSPPGGGTAGGRASGAGAAPAGAGSAASASGAGGTASGAGGTAGAGTSGGAAASAAPAASGAAAAAAVPVAGLVVTGVQAAAGAAQQMAQGATAPPDQR